MIHSLQLFKLANTVRKATSDDIAWLFDDTLENLSEKEQEYLGVADSLLADFHERHPSDTWAKTATDNEAIHKLLQRYGYIANEDNTKWTR